MKGGAILLMLVLAVPAAADVAPTDWRQAMTIYDRKRLRDWRGAWTRALAEARADGGAAAVAADPALFDPDAALVNEVAPPPGDYRCRHIAVGARPDGSALVFGPSGRCRIEGAGSPRQLVDFDGGERYPGSIYLDTDRRAIFLGTTMIGGEGRPQSYGHAAGRDLAGVIERVGERRWRLVLPYPRFGASLILVELVSA